MPHQKHASHSPTAATMTLFTQQQQQRTGSSTLHLLNTGMGCCGAAPLPSTLTYQERAQMRHTAAFEYSRIYNSSQGTNVYDRLTADAAVRSTLKSVHAAASAARLRQADAATWSAASVDGSSTAGVLPGGAGGGDGGKAARRYRSGFVSNTTSNLDTQQHQQQHHCHDSDACSDAPSAPSSALRHATLQAAWKRCPMDCLEAARPSARTTNETLAALGTYGAGDAAFAARLGLHIPRH